MDVNIINKKGLTDFELGIVEDYSNKFHSKLTIDHYKHAKNVKPQLFISVKKHAKKPSGDMLCNYSIHIKLEAPNIVVAAHENDYDLRKALNKTFDNIVHEIEHKFKDISAKIKRAKNLKR